MICSNRLPLLVTLFLIYLAVPCPAQESAKVDDHDDSFSEWEKEVSAENTAKVGAKLLPESNEIGQTFGAALNPANSAIERVPAVNAAAAQGAEISDTVQLLKAGNRISDADAAMLQALLQMQLLEGVEQGSAGNSSQSSSSPQESGFVAPKTTITGGFGAGESVGTVPEITTVAATTPVKTPSRSNIEVEPVAEAFSQPQSQIIRPDGTTILIPNVAAAKDSQSAANQSQDLTSEKLLNRELASNSKAMTADGVGLAYRAGEARGGGEKDDSGLSGPLLGNLISKLKIPKAGQKTGPNSPNGFAPIIPAIGSAPEDPISQKTPATPSLADKKDWPEWPEYFADPKILRQHFPEFFRKVSSISAPFTSTGAGPSGYDSYILITLLLALFSGAGIWRLAHVWKKRSTSGQTDYRKEQVQVVFPAASEYRPRLIKASKGWTLNLQHRVNHEMVAVGLLKEDAVIAADWLSPSLQNDLGVEHGGEALRLHRGEFEKTLTPMNPAIQPFPEKIDFLVSSGMARKRSNS